MNIAEHEASPTGSRPARAGLWFLLLLTLVTRAVGLGRPLWVDESPILRNIAVFLGERTLVPPHFSYPPLYSYLSTPPTGVAAVVGGMFTGIGPQEWAVLDSGTGAFGLLVGPRLVSIALSLLAVWVIWRATAGVELELRLLAGGAFALSPVAIRYGTMALPDVGAAAFAVLAVLLAEKHLAAEGVRARRGDWLFAAGAALGVAAAFKYNAGLAALALLLAVSIRSDRHRGVLLLAAAGGVSLLLFLILAPTWWLVPSEAWGGFRFESENVRTPRPGSEPYGPLGLFLSLLFTEPVVALGILGGAAGYIHSRDHRLLLWFPVPLVSVLVIGTWGKQDANYFLPVMGVAAVSLARGVGAIPAGAFRRFAVGVGAVWVLAVMTFDWPMPPWSEARMERVLREELSPNAALIRLGLNTPKIWDDEVEREFLEGLGQALSERGRDVFRRRIATQPRAGAVVIFYEDHPAARSLLNQSEGPLYVIATDMHLRMLLSAGDHELEADDTLREAATLAEELHTGEQWRLVAETRGGEGWGLLLYRRYYEDTD